MSGRGKAAAVKKTPAKTAGANGVCPHCEKKLETKGKFCHHCGRALEISKSTAGVYTWAMEDLFDIARSLSATLDLDTLLKRIGHAAEHLTLSEASSILLLDDDRKSLYFKVATGEKGNIIKRLTVPVGTGIAGWVAQHWKPLIVNDVSKDPRFMKLMDNTTGFVTRSVLAVPLMIGGEALGVCEVINKKKPMQFNESDQNILQNLANFAAVSITNAKLAENQKNFFTNMIEILTAAIEARDPRYMGHPTRVASLACAIGKRMGIEGEGYRMLYYAGLLHDIGMIAVNHSVLMDQASLLARDRSVERVHPVLGAELIKGVRLLQGIVPLVRHHHELWDGSGYPDRLAGEQIPLAARILCLVEYLEELRISGVREPDLGPMQVQLAKNGSGTKFDPAVVQAYLEQINQRAT